MVDRIADFLAARCRWLALVCLLSAAVPLYLLKDMRIDNSIEVWFGTETTEHAEYREFVEKYGNEEFVAIAAQTDDPLSPSCLALQRALAGRLRQIDGVDDVFNIADIADIVRQVRPDWKDILQRNEFFRNLLLGADGQTYGLIVWLKRIDDPTARKLAVERIESVVDEVDAGRIGFHMAGTPLMNVALDRGSQNASRKFLPVALLVSIGFLTAALRSLRGMVAVVAAVAVTTLWTLGGMVLLDKTLNMVTVVLPSLLFVLCLSGGIHIVCTFRAEAIRSDDLHLALRNTLREVMRPVFLSNVTTAVGFGALMVSNMQPVIDFGMFAAIGMLFSILSNFMVVPGLLSILHAGGGRERSANLHWSAAIGEAAVRRRRWVLSAAGIVFLMSIGLTTRARVESNVLKFFPNESKISRDYQFIAQNLTGLYTVELDASTETQNGSTVLKAIDKLSGRLAERPEVAKVINYRNLATCLAEIPRPAFVPSQASRKNPLKLMLRKYQRVEDDQISLRMSVLVRAMSSSDFYVLVDLIENEAKQHVGQLAEYTITGAVPLLNAAQQSLIDTQIRSFAIACSVILVLIAVFMKSIRAMLVAVLPNLVPIFSVFAVMVMLNIPFDTATVMIASVAIGIAADDTIHFLSHFRHEKKSGNGTDAAVRGTFQRAGRAITFTSVVACAGFVILLLAEFKPIQYFGMLGSVTMITAWIGDVFILPACVACFRLWD